MADSKTRIHYDDLVQNALIGVVRQVLADTAKHGLQGAHHFYIAFRTDHPGVSMPAYLKERYKEEMTVVLQNQFWDLKVTDDHFEVGLSFNQKPAMLTIPFDALTGFLDPSVEFGLQFQRSGAKSTPKKKAEPAAEKAPAKAAERQETPPEDDGPKPGGDANVVTLDRFRKKK